jgi:hypothetical protein
VRFTGNGPIGMQIGEQPVIRLAPAVAHRLSRSAIAARPSAFGVAAVHGQGDADDEAGSGTAQPQHRRGDLVGPAESGDRLVGDGLGHVELTIGDHVGDHRCLDRARPDRV